MKIPFDKLEEAFYFSGNESSYWVDKETGKVIFIWADTDSLIDDANNFEDESEREATRKILIILGEIESDEEVDESRFVEIETPNSDESWQMRAEFAEDLEDVEIHNKLAYALRGGKPFQKFKNTLLNYPDIREKWFEFEKEKFQEYIEKWAEMEEIEIEYETEKSK